ncbi:MAG: spermine synthase [Chthoniobacterales bacterium]
MIPFRNLAEVLTPDGSRLTLHEHDGEYFIKLNGRQLMSSTSTSSELLLAERGCSHLAHHPSPRVLIGGLGLGFTLERVLGLIGPHGSVEVAELVPEVVTWNREFLRELNGRLLDDPRVEMKVADVFAILRNAPRQTYDSILLDVDNGPTSFVQTKNKRIYSRKGLSVLRDALRPNGRVAFWSAEAEPMFAQSLQRAGFDTESVPAKANEHAKRFAHLIYVGIRTDYAATR